ncbi:MAG: hypothetical protein LH467_09735, partial [Gemmatimonadaceae bacterium]|nr:hypothetical protein [Gemmatimonadaceae bacterium]
AASRRRPGASSARDRVRAQHAVFASLPARWSALVCKSPRGTAANNVVGPLGRAMERLSGG